LVFCQLECSDWIRCLVDEVEIVVVCWVKR